MQGGMLSRPEPNLLDLSPVFLSSISFVTAYFAHNVAYFSHYSDEPCLKVLLHDLRAHVLCNVIIF